MLSKNKLSALIVLASSIFISSCGSAGEPGQSLFEMEFASPTPPELSAGGELPEQASMPVINYTASENTCVRTRLEGGGGGGGQDVRVNFNPGEAVLLELDQPRAVHFAAFVPGKNMILTNSGGVVYLWDAGSGQEINQIQGENGIYAITLSEDGSALAGRAGGDDFVRIWEIPGFQELARIDSGYSDIFSFDRNSEWLAIANGEAVSIWDPGSMEEVQNFSIQGNRKIADEDTSGGDIIEFDAGHGGRPPSTIQFSPDNRVLLTAGWDAAVRLWDLDSGNHLRCFESGLPEERDDLINKFISASFSPDGRKIVGLLHKVEQFESTIIVWDAETGEEITRIPFPNTLTPPGFVKYFLSAIFSPDLEGEYILTSGMDNTARIWDADSGGLQKVMIHPAITNWAEFNLSGDRIVTGFGTGLDGPKGAWVWNVNHPDLPAAVEVEQILGQAIQDLVGGQFDNAMSKFNQVQGLESSTNLSGLVAIGRAVAVDYLFQQISQKLFLPDIPSALEMHSIASAIAAPDGIENPEYWYYLCHFGSLNGGAQQVLDIGACEQLVSVSTATNNSDDIAGAYESRAIARALTGDLTGAADDLEIAVAYYMEVEFFGGRDRNDTRQTWVEQLRSGQNPFDEATLKAIRLNDW